MFHLSVYFQLFSSVQSEHGTPTPQIVPKTSLESISSLSYTLQIKFCSLHITEDLAVSIVLVQITTTNTLVPQVCSIGFSSKAQSTGPFSTSSYSHIIGWDTGQLMFRGSVRHINHCVSSLWVNERNFGAVSVLGVLEKHPLDRSRSSVVYGHFYRICTICHTR